MGKNVNWEYLRPWCLVRKPKIPPLGIHILYRRKSNIAMDFQQIGLVVADQTHLAQMQDFFQITLQLFTLLRNILPHGIRQNIVCISCASIKYFLVGLIENT
jgi:hypothetical protein